MILDIHTHLWDQPEHLGPGVARRLVVERGGEPWNRPAVTTDSLAEASAPVDRLVIHGFASKLLGISIPMERVARWVADDPIKRLGFAGVDPMADDFSEQIPRAVSLGLKGLTISPAAQGFAPADYRAHALFTQAVKQNLPVMVLPGLQLTPAAVMEFAQPHLFDAAGKQFPDLCIVFAQVGYPWIEPTLTLLSKHRRFYASISGLTHRPWLLYQTLLSACQIGVADKLLFGSDFPFALPQQAISSIYAISDMVRGTQFPSIPREILQQIVERDALACLGLHPRDNLDSFV